MRDTSPEQVLYRLDEDDCWALLERCVLGRLAVSAEGSVDLFPVNYAVEGRRILFKTSEGTKLDALTARREVAFEIDGVDDQTAWSVVVKGVAAPLEQRSDAEAAARRRVVSWLPTAKSRVVAIEPVQVTGRAFLRGPEPDEEWY